MRRTRSARRVCHPVQCASPPPKPARLDAVDRLLHGKGSFASASYAAALHTVARNPKCVILDPKWLGRWVLHMFSHSDFQISALIANSLKAKMLLVKGTKHCQGLVHAPPPVETQIDSWLETYCVRILALFQPPCWCHLKLKTNMPCKSNAQLPA